MANDKNLQVCKYSIDEVILIYSDNTSEKIKPMNVSSINIEKDFDLDFFPIFNLNLTVTQDTYKKVTVDKKAKIRLTINKFFVKSAKDEIPTGPKYMEPVISKVFYLMTNEADNSHMTKVSDEAAEVKGTDKKTDYNTPLSLYLYDEKFLDINNVPESYIYSDTDPLTAVVHMCSQLRVEKMLVSEPDNPNKQPQIIIPAAKFKKAIHDLETVYGIYDCGSVLYYDFDHLYYISRDIVGNQALLENESNMVNIQFNEVNDGDDMIGGGYLDKSKNRYFINASRYPTIYNTGSYTQEATFTNIKSINTESGDSSDTSIELDGRDIKNTRIIDNKYNNPHIIKSSAYILKESNFILGVELLDVDISYLTPNKRYTMKFNFKDMKNALRYDGNYRLGKITTSLAKSGTEHYFDLKAACTFKRGKDTKK